MCLEFERVMDRVRCALLLLEGDRDPRGGLSARQDRVVALPASTGLRGREQALRTLGKLLEDDGYCVDISIGCAAALSRLARPPAPDAVLADMSFHSMSEEMVLRCARASFPEQPVFLMTADPRGAEAAFARLGPKVFVLAKPFEYSRLAALFRNAFKASLTNLVTVEGQGHGPRRRARQGR